MTFKSLYFSLYSYMLRIVVYKYSIHIWSVNQAHHAACNLRLEPQPQASLCLWKILEIGGWGSFNFIFSFRSSLHLSSIHCTKLSSSMCIHVYVLLIHNCCHSQLSRAMLLTKKVSPLCRVTNLPLSLYAPESLNTHPI